MPENAGRFTKCRDDVYGMPLFSTLSVTLCVVHNYIHGVFLRQSPYVVVIIARFASYIMIVVRRVDRYVDGVTKIRAVMVGEGGGHDAYFRARMRSGHFAS